MKKILRQHFLFMIVILTSCATHKTNQVLIQEYKLARKLENTQQNEKSCDLYENLSESDVIPFKDLALYHSLFVCDYSNRKIKKIYNEYHPPKYLIEHFLAKGLEISQQRKLELLEAQIIFDFVDFKKIQKDKIDLLKRSIKILTDLGEDTLLIKHNEKLNSIAPRLEKTISKDNIFKVAKSYETNREYQKARELYDQVIGANDPSIEYDFSQRVKAMNARRLSYKLERNLKTFLEKTYEMEKKLKENLLKTSKEDDHYNLYEEAWADSVMTLARAVWTDHQRDDALSILSHFIESQLGSETQMANAYWIMGSIKLEEKENNKALNFFQKAANFKIKDATILENVQWSVVWNQYLLKKYRTLQKYVDQFNAQSTNPLFLNKLSYWKARSLILQNKREKAYKILEDIINNDPFSYYATLANIELNKSFSPLKIKFQEPLASGNHLLDWLIGLGENDFAISYLKEINSKFRTINEREKAMNYYQQVKWYQGAMKQITNLPYSNRNELTYKYIDLIFPTPYLNIIIPIAKKYDVPIELALSIIRQESSFVPTERSSADAFGLMQLIPERAKSLAAKYKIPYKDVNDLYRPEINIELGMAMLSELRQNYHQKFVQTVAAYNASGTAIKKWEEERFDGDYVHFIEMIPYEETRNYIKLVFRNYITYKRILGDKEFTITNNFFNESF